MNRLLHLFVEDAWLAAGVAVSVGICALLVQAAPLGVLLLPLALGASLLASLRRRA
jgi:hypothetical protein